MKNLLALCCFLCASSVFAGGNDYNLQIVLRLNGKLIAAPLADVKAGKWTSIQSHGLQNNKTFLEVVLREYTSEKGPAVQMNFTEGIISEAGKKIVIAKPSISALDNHLVQFTIEEPDQGTLLVSVVASRRI